MCWSGEASFTVATLGTVAALYLKKEEHHGIE